MDKGWHGGNRIKVKDANPSEERCRLCSGDDSQAHWLHSCSHPAILYPRSQAFLELETLGATRSAKLITSAFITVLKTTPAPERIWTGNWSRCQIDHFESLLLISSCLPSTSAGWLDLKSTVYAASRILARTAMHLWTTKVILETPARLAALSSSSSGKRAPQPARFAPPSSTLLSDSPTPYVTPTSYITGQRCKRPLPTPITSKPPPPSRLILPEPSVQCTTFLRLMFSRGNSFVLNVPNIVAPSRIPWSITGADLYNIATSNMISNIALDGILSLLLPASLSPRIHCYPTDFFTHLALAAFGYSPDAGTRYTIFRPLLRPGAHLSLIPVSHALHFTLLLVDHQQHKLKGYDSLFGPPNQESTILSHLRILKQSFSPPTCRFS